MQIHFWTTDVDAAIAYYADVLGFELAFSQPDQGPREFCILRLGDQQVMFGSPPEDLIGLARIDKRLLETAMSRIGGAGPLSIYLAVEDVDDHYCAVKAAGADVVEPLWQTPWGLRQYSVSDMDGQLLTFHG